MSNVTLSQILAAVRSANDAVSEVQRRVDAVDTANLMRLNFDDGVYDSSGDGSEYGYIITNTGMDLYASDDGTPTAGNYSEALAYGYYCKWDDDTSAPFATLSDGDATNSRIDTVYVNRFGVKVAEGTPAASPTAASIPTNALKLYEVTVPANETDGSGLTLTDSRTFLSTFSDAYKSGGTDVAVADGGTGASTVAGALSNFGLAKPKLDATAAPTVNDDTGDGYEPGSLWVDVTNDKGYLCLDATSGAAVWTEVTVDTNALHGNASGEIAALTEKTTPVDADVTVIEDSASSNAKKKLTWANIKATLKTYFDTLYILKSIGTAKGDLIGFSSSGTPVRIAVGSNDQVLTADSAQSSGVKWAASAGGGSSLGGAYAKLGSNMALSGTPTKVQFNTEVRDDNSEYDPTTNYRFTAGRSGVLAIEVGIGVYNCTSNGQVTITVYKNGSSEQSLIENAVLTSTDPVSISKKLELSVSSSDYFEIYAECSGSMSLYGSAVLSYVQYQWMN